MQAFEQELDGAGHHAGVLRPPGQRQYRAGQRRQLGQGGGVGRGREIVAGVHHGVGGERPDHALRIVQHHPAAKDQQDGSRQQLGEQDLLAALLEGIDLHLALGRGDQSLEVADPGDRLGLAGAQRPAQGVGHQGLVVGDAEAHRHPGALVDVGALAGQVAELGHHLGHEPGHLDPDRGGAPSDVPDPDRPGRSASSSAIRSSVAASGG